MIAQAVSTARAAGATGQILVRGDCAYGNTAVIGAPRRAGARFSLVLTTNAAVTAAIDAIDVHAWIPGALSRRGLRPRHRRLISDAEVAEITFTAFASTDDADHHPVDRPSRQRRQYPDPLFPVWRYHPLFTELRRHHRTRRATNITHRRHAISETVFADLIDGPWPACPPGGSANAPGSYPPPSHNLLLRAAGDLAGDRHRVARAATLRRILVGVPARLARPQRRPVVHLPRHWPWADAWLRLWDNTIRRP